MGSPNRLNPYRCCKRDRKRNRGSQTPGKTKSGGYCKATSLDKYMVTHNRSYKHYKYGDWLHMMMQRNSMGGGR